MNKKIAAMALLFLGVVYACGHPPVNVYCDGSSATVGLQTLGEYPTSVQRVVLSEVERGTVLWDISALSDGAQVWELKLEIGENVVIPQAFHGGFEANVPNEGDTFLIRQDKEYQIEIWFPSGGQEVISIGCMKTNG